jgi:hypothetical protein
MPNILLGPNSTRVPLDLKEVEMDTRRRELHLSRPNWNVEWNWDGTRMGIHDSNLQLLCGIPFLRGWNRGNILKEGSLSFISPFLNTEQWNIVNKSMNSGMVDNELTETDDRRDHQDENGYHTIK